jgi:hypothetical protein
MERGLDLNHIGEKNYELKRDMGHWLLQRCDKNAIPILLINNIHPNLKSTAWPSPQ